jgi:hypothetical protein
METRKLSLFSLGVLTTVATLVASNAFAQLSCTSRTTNEGAGNFIVNVSQQNQNGNSSYLYSIQSPTNKNPNKFFAFVGRGLKDDLVARDTTNNSPGVYVTPHQFSSNFPPADAWRVVHHHDGVVFPSIAIGHQFRFEVPVRSNPEEGVTTILLGIGNTYEHCGPILGPMGPGAVQEGPLVVTTAHLTFENGCSYFADVDPTTKYVVSLTVDPATPNETVCGPTGCKACQVDSNADCAGDLELVFCPQLRIGENPIQSEAGGTCYYPPNIKFTC